MKKTKETRAENQEPRHESQGAEIKSPAVLIIEYFNEITGRKFRTTNKTYLNAISKRFKDGFTEEQIKEVIQVKTIEWKNNPTMSVHLNPETIFRPSNFEKYVNQVEVIKQNPKLYAKHFAKINGIATSTTASNNHDTISDLYG